MRFRGVEVDLAEIRHHAAFLTPEQRARIDAEIDAELDRAYAAALEHALPSRCVVGCRCDEPAPAELPPRRTPLWSGWLRLRQG